MSETETYTCALCGGVFEKGQSDEEALAESRAYFGDVPPEELAVVCDDCWEEVRPDRQGEGSEVK
jgi:rubredoxin